MLLLRRVFFYLLVVVYLIFCPVIILYALGYIYKPGREQGIVKSGLIYLSTTPSGASVYLDHRRFIRKTPAVIADLLPGDYPVRLVLKGYQTWSEVLPVEAGKATVLEKVLFLPNQWEKEKLSGGDFENLTAVGGTRYFILRKGDKTGGLFLYDWKEEKMWPVLSGTSFDSEAEVLSLFTAKDSAAFLLRIQSGQGEKFLWVIPKTREAQVKDLTSLFLTSPDRVEWDPQGKRHIFLLRANSVDRIDTASGELSPRFLEGVRGFGLSDKRIYVLNDRFIFERLDFDGNQDKVLMQDPNLGRSLFGEGSVYQIRIFPDEVIVFWNEKGALLVNRLPYRFVEEGVQGFQYDPKQKRLLLWKKNAIGILDFSEEHNSKGAFETGPKLTWVWKQAKKIEQAFWVYESSHVLFRDQNDVFLLDLETYGKPHLHEILHVKSGSSITYSEESGKLYFLESKTGSLSAIEILPSWQIPALPFPERKAEKKKSEIVEL